jgi:WD40 repeat protein
MKNINKNAHCEGVNSVLVSFDNRFLVSKGKNSVKVWDVLKGVELRTMMVTDESSCLDLIGESVIGWLATENLTVQ